MGALGDARREYFRYLRLKRHQKPDIKIGSRGIHDRVLDAIRELLERKGVVKVRVLRSVATTKKDTEAIAEILSEKLNVDYIKVIGRSIILGCFRDFMKKSNKR